MLVTLSRSEGSIALGNEMLRGVYTERSECAQHDKAGPMPKPLKLPYLAFLGEGAVRHERILLRKGLSI